MMFDPLSAGYFILAAGLRRVHALHRFPCAEAGDARQVRLCLSFTLMCKVPSLGRELILSPSMNGLSPRWLVPVADVARQQRVDR
jgi:hypothetical protein